MKKITFFLSALLISMMSFAGEVEMSTFTATSADMDGYISYSTNQGGGTTAPAINNGVIRLYQNNYGDAGGNITITAKPGATITEVTIGSAMATTIKWEVDETEDADGTSLAANAKATKSGISTTSITCHCYGTNKNSRLYVNYLKVVYTVEAGVTPDPTPDPEEPGDDVTGNPAATIAAGTNGSACTVNGKDGIKVGTSSKGGSMTITVPANATALQFYAAAWNKVTDLSINITPADKVATASIELTADAGIANSTPFTLSGEEASFYYEVALNNITEETTLTVETSIEKRFVIWGVTYTASSNEGGENPEPTPDPEPEPDPEPTPDPEEPETPVLPEGVITCAEAVAICNEVGSTATTETYTIRGYVTNIVSAYNAGYNNISFWMADTKDGGNVFQAYRSTPTTDTDKAVKVGDYVEVTGQLTLYGTTPEVKQGGTYAILEAAEGEPETPVLPEFPEGPITCAQALEVCLATGTTSTTDTYTIQGYVTEIKDAYSTQYQNISFWMADTKGGENVILAFRVKGDATVKVGDKVEVIGTLVNYYGNTPEVNAGGTYTILEVAEGGETPEPEPELPEGLTGEGTEENPFTVEDVITLNNAVVGPYYVKGYIIGVMDNNKLYSEAPFEVTTNLVIASTMSETTNIVPVQLPTGDLRASFNLKDNPTMFGALVLIQGKLEAYFQKPGIKNPTSIEKIESDGTTTGLDNITIDTNITKTIVNGQLIIIKNGVKYNAQGQVVK